ncbi:DUF2977 domain-containing protein [Pediococcus acidilactici]|uniref:DUF2977 domain-containing protein n=1 Tax=Pediococcus acidilactici TaxID=1254 RepID=UPI00132A9D4B|nr:DUF2977 domain-containing protein [Pediococcus acidilactici]KAF0376448.1 DUF2977 domain-containing protein [Pediococcus acidilactici]KAF0407692.1 DUF2977 domain-containing protein [Pediococcus acidilactici]KAF0419200.1 DUF2977 domain-containing protein [Pediococcus acidilactici]KAF0456745.1 DUF2977 domain-containing protein [Pediococcus acidilactici]KAF0487451.1 DUF2977 domain-containing protein [Pediococcus acidilactici]
MSLQLELNDKNEILSYLKFGGIEEVRLTEYDGLVPDNFEDDFKPLYFMIKDNTIVENPDYEPTNPEPTGPSDVQLIIMQQAKTIVQMQSVMMQQNKDIAELKGVQE